MMTVMLKMEHVFSVVRDYMHSESEAGFPSLRSIPSTRATAFFDYLENISPAEREELLDARARVTALGFVPTPAARDEMLQVMNSHPALVKWTPHADFVEFPVVTRISPGSTGMQNVIASGHLV
jgi:hypothetical protein